MGPAASLPGAPSWGRLADSLTPGLPGQRVRAPQVSVSGAAGPSTRSGRSRLQPTALGFLFFCGFCPRPPPPGSLPGYQPRACPPGPITAPLRLPRAPRSGFTSQPGVSESPASASASAPEPGSRVGTGDGLGRGLLVPRSCAGRSAPCPGPQRRLPVPGGPPLVPRRPAGHALEVHAHGQGRRRPAVLHGPGAPGAPGGLARAGRGPRQPLPRGPRPLARMPPAPGAQPARG